MESMSKIYHENFDLNDIIFRRECTNEFIQAQEK